MRGKFSIVLFSGTGDQWMATTTRIASAAARAQRVVRGLAGRRVPPAHKLPLAFFVLTFALASPFWVLGAVTGVALLPGLPIAALIAVCPVAAAVILVAQEKGGGGVRTLLQRAFDFQRIEAGGWYLPTLLLMPVVALLSFGVLRLTGVAVPAPQIPLVPTLLLGLVFFIGALGEEVGWLGYAVAPLQARWGALGASLVLGAIWAVYHYVGLRQVDRSWEWIAWWSLGTVALRVILVWLYNNTGGSVGAAALFHTTVNLTWQLFPVHGSYYDPRISGIILAGVAGGIALIWPARTLTRRRSAPD